MRGITLVVALWAGVLAPAWAEQEKALFAGGCFWCMEAAFQERQGVLDVVSGFTGGALANPSYAGNHSGHFEAIEVTFDPAVVSYRQLLDLYWVNIDPLDNSGQFCDKGASYRSAIFAVDESQLLQARASLAAVEQRFSPAPVYTEIRPAGRFWPVEEAHQDYYRKNPLRYKYYRWNCGRDQRLQQLWGAGAAVH
ncbi:MAG: peptide-methionine (S)-S-oxide reductase MsrA [Pseudomonadales bacterium]|nr:peptide-methionine (S)-S-oxide reductase MsrA [Pseudomonadales bacterium]